MSRQQSLFYNPSIKKDAPQNLPGLSVTSEGAKAWDEVKEAFADLYSDKTKKSKEIIGSFLGMLTEACRLEKPGFEVTEIVDFLCKGRGELKKLISEVYAINMEIAIYRLNRRQHLPPKDRYLSEEDITTVKDTVDGLIFIKTALGKEIGEHKNGKALLQDIEHNILWGIDYLERTAPRPKL